MSALTSTLDPDSGSESEIDDMELQQLENDLLNDSDANETYLPSSKAFRDELEEILPLRNFDLSENCPCNYRDKAILGHQPAVELPTEFMQADLVHLSIWLNYDVEINTSTLVSMPVLERKPLEMSGKNLSRKFSTDANGLWICPKDVGPKRLVEFKKRKMKLSGCFREACGAKWPQFVFVATIYSDGNPVKSIRSSPFEVRSKEQSDKNMASRGLAAGSTSKRRRTPESEARTVALHALQQDIVAKRAFIQKQIADEENRWTKLNFIMAILKSQSATPAMSQMLDICQQNIAILNKWKK